MSTRGQGYYLSQDTHSITLSNMFSKLTKPIVTKFHVKSPGVDETKICSNRPGQKQK